MVAKMLDKRIDVQRMESLLLTRRCKKGDHNGVCVGGGGGLTLEGGQKRVGCWYFGDYFHHS